MSRQFDANIAKQMAVLKTCEVQLHALAESIFGEYTRPSDAEIKEMFDSMSPLAQQIAEICPVVIDKICRMEEEIKKNLEYLSRGQEEEKE